MKNLLPLLSFTFIFSISSYFHFILTFFSFIFSISCIFEFVMFYHFCRSLPFSFDFCLFLTFTLLSSFLISYSSFPISLFSFPTLLSSSSFPIFLFSSLFFLSYFSSIFSHLSLLHRCEASSTIPERQSTNFISPWCLRQRLRYEWASRLSYSSCSCSLIDRKYRIYATVVFLVLSSKILKQNNKLVKCLEIRTQEILISILLFLVFRVVIKR